MTPARRDCLVLTAIPSWRRCSDSWVSGPRRVGRRSGHRVARDAALGSRWRGAPPRAGELVGDDPPRRGRLLAPRRARSSATSTLLRSWQTPAVIGQRGWPRRGGSAAPSADLSPDTSPPCRWPSVRRRSRHQPFCGTPISLGPLRHWRRPAAGTRGEPDNHAVVLSAAATVLVGMATCWQQWVCFR